MDKSFWDNKRVLVTGAGGFKGAHLVEKLSESNAEIVSLVRDFNPKSYFSIEKLGERSLVVVGDLKNAEQMKDIISRYEITSIFHLGAQPIVTTALVNPKETLESNILGTVNVLEAVRLCGSVEEMVMVSSDKAYGPSKVLPYKEDYKLEGKAPYDVSKSCADLITQMYSQVYELPVAVARCSNVFGPGDLNMNRLIPGLMRALIRNQPFDIRSDGKMVREFIYVKEAIDAYVFIAENIGKTRGEAFNVAGKTVLPVMDVINNTFSVLGKSVPINIVNNTKAEIYEQYLDGSKIKDILGWEAMFVFDDAIRETYSWYSKVLR